MSSKKNKNYKKRNNIHSIEKNTEAITRSTERLLNQLKIISNNTNPAPQKKSTKYVAIISTLITILIAIISLLVDISGFTIKDVLTDSKNAAQPYKIYLTSEYTKLMPYCETDLNANLNFNADSVTITAYLNSNQSGDTLTMQQRESYEWYKKVLFEKCGTYTVVATATTATGDVISNSLKIEVTSPIIQTIP